MLCSDEYIEITKEFDVDFYIDSYLNGSDDEVEDPIAHYISVGWKRGYDPSRFFSTKKYIICNPSILHTSITPFYHYLINKYERKEFSMNIDPTISTEICKTYNTILREFDRDFYYQKYIDISEGEIDPILHYIEAGWKEGRDPSPNFSTKYYLDTNNDVKETGINPFYHYIKIGRNEGKSIAPSGYAVTTENIEKYSAEYEIVAREFNRDFYFEKYPDIAEGNLDPVFHYIEAGWKEGRDPAPDFSTQSYLEANPNIKESGVNPFYHYIKSGHAEEKLKIDNNNNTTENVEKYSAEYQIVAREFNRDFYFEKYPDIAEGNLDPVFHYIEAGWKEERDPSPDFSTKYYLAANPDVKESGVNPFYHYIKSGRAEGKPSAKSGSEATVENTKKYSAEYEIVAREFDRDFYFEKYSDIAGGNVDPVLHYIEAGWKEQRDPSPDFSTKYYLDTNPDIKNGGINPFYHYIKSGRTEGRKAYSYLEYLRKKQYRPKVSVIVPNYNHGKFLRERLDSILNQTYDNFELLILDDCSTDDSREIIREYHSKYPSQVKIYLNEKNSGGVFKQWQKGLYHAAGNIIWICESDDLCELNFLETLIGYFADPSIMIAFGRIQYIDENSLEFSGLDNYRENACPGIWDGEYIETASHWFNNAFGVSNIIANVGGCLFRKQKLSDDVWDKAQKFTACADWYLYIILANAGRIAYNALAKSYFRQHGKNTSVSTSINQKYYDEHYRVAKFLRNYHGIDDITLFNFYINIAEHYKYSFKTTKADGLAPLLNINSLINEKKTIKHIAIAFLGFYLGGGEIFPINLANQLVEMGYTVSVLALNQDKEVAAIKEKLNPKIPVYYRYLINEIGIEDFIHNLGADLIHSHNRGWEHILKSSTNAMQIPYIVTHHGGYEADEINAGDLLDFLRLVDHWVYIADKNLNLFNGIPLKSSIFSKLPNAVPYNKVDFSLTRHELGITDDSFVFGIASRALKTKGWEEAIKAVISLSEKTDKKLFLLLCGDGEEKDRLSEIYNFPNIKFLGYQSNIHGFYNLCNCCLLPTKFAGESFPLTLVESIQSGTPIIATDVGEIKNILIEKDLKAGELIPWEENESKFIKNLVVAMLNILDERKYNFFEECIEKMAGKYDMENLARRYIDIYNRILG